VDRSYPSGKNTRLNYDPSLDAEFESAAVEYFGSRKRFETRKRVIGIQAK
jgi:hypothetical protein